MCVILYHLVSAKKQQPKECLNFRSNECIGELRKGKYSVTEECL